MERQLWDAIVEVMQEVRKPVLGGRFDFSIVQILQVWFWAVVHDRPVSWAVQPRNWPSQLRRRPLPTSSTMSRRMKSRVVLDVLSEVEKRVVRSTSKDNLVWMIDGKPLPIGGCSKDRQAGYGRAAGGKAKGYKLHAILGNDGKLAEWRIAPMNKDERVMAQRMLKAADIQGYVACDTNYDSNKLHALCDQLGNRQMIVPRRYGKGAGLGHRRHAPGRLRSKEILEDPFPEFGQQIMEQRNDIERYFGNLTNWAAGLTNLPPWARTHRRVKRWVQAKLIITHLKTSI